MSDDTSLPDLAAGVPAADVVEGAMLKGCFGEQEVVVARTGGRLHAVSAACTHLGAPLDEGLLIDGQVRCPWHHARFDLATGEAVGAPAFAPLGCFTVEEVDGRIRITGRRAEAAKAPARAQPQRVLIVGGGAAGYACAEMLTRLGLGAGVTVVSDDADAPYDRTFCSKQYLSGQAPREKATLASDGFWSEEGPRLRTGTRVLGLDLGARDVELEGGERPGWDVLVLATGAQPRRPDLPGFDDPERVRLLRTLADADALIAASAHAQRVAVVGASFIGMEAAAALTERGLAVTVVAPESTPLAEVLGEEAGRYVQSLHEQKGVAFKLGRKVERFDRPTLVLDDGSTLDADLVVVGQGVSPRVELARAAGLDMHEHSGGVRVDDRLRASAPGVFAVGDVAAYPGPVNKVIRVEHWVHAERQGQHVARVIAGQDARFSDLPFFWTNHYGTSVDYDGHAEEIAAARPEGDVAKGEFAVTLAADGRDAALVTCARAVEALRWEAAHEPA